MKILQPILLVIMILLAGCSNPLGKTENGKSSVTRTDDGLSELPSSFRFTSYDFQSSQVTLFWAKSERANSYQVKYGTASGVYTFTASCNSSPCVITGLTNGITYYFTVVAKNSIGSTNIASELSIALTNAPSIPTGISASSNNGSVTLSWLPSTGDGAIKYKVLRSTTSGKDYTLLTTNLTTTNYTDTDVINGRTYYYVVRSFNEYGEGTNSVEAIGTPMAPPAPPTALRASSNSSQIALDWTASTGSGTITYNVYRSIFSGSGYTLIATNVSVNSYVDTTISRGINYYYVIQSANLVGTSNYSTEVNAISLAMPTSLSISGTTSKINLSWAQVAGATSYNVYRSTISGNYVLVTPFNTTTNGYIDTTVIDGTTYFYVVTAVKGSSESSNQSIEVSSMPVAAPGSLITSIGASSVTLNWAGPIGATSYNIYRSTTSGSYSVALATGFIGTSYTDTTAIAGLNYYYIIKAISTNSISIASSEVNVKPLSNFAITSVSVNGANALQVSWTASTGATSYTLSFGTSAGSYTTTLTNRTSPVTISSLAAGTTYYFMVSAINSTGSLNSDAEAQGVPLGGFALTSLTPQINATNIAWGMSEGSTSYDILYGTTSGSYTTTLTGKTSPSIVSPLAAGSTYFFKVRANNASGSLVSTNELSGVVLESFALNIPFTAGTESSYVFSNSSASDFTGGVFRLTPSDLIDDDSTSNGFGGATFTGTQYDLTRGYVRLDLGTNNSELDSTWTPMWSSLVGYWKLNESSGSMTVADSSPVGTNKGTVVSTVALGGNGKIKTAATFDGKSYIDLGTSDTLRPTSQITVNAWIKKSVSSSEEKIVGGDAASGGGYSFFVTSSQLVFRDGRANAAVANWTLNDNKWHMVTGTMASGGLTKVYIDGVLAATANHPGLISKNGNSLIMGNEVGRSYFFRGSIDEVAIWSSALSLEQIQMIYNRQSAQFSGLVQSRVMDAYFAQPWTNLQALTTLPFYKEMASSQESSSSTNGYSSMSSNLNSGLVGLWYLNEKAGTLVSDASGKSNNGRLFGALVSETGKLGSSIRFNGSTNYIEVPFSNTLNTSIFSTCSWVNLNGGRSTNRSLISNRDGISPLKGFSIFASNGETWDFYTGDGNSTWSILKGPTVSYYKWQYICATFNGNTKILYIDGVAVASAVGNMVLNTTRPLRIGASANETTASLFFNGLIDEVAVWDRSLSASEIRELYRRGANRIKYQIRTCASADCLDQEALTSSFKGWKGPDNTGLSYFSELYNRSSNSLNGSVLMGNPAMTFSNFNSSGLNVTNNRYFQYRAILESDDENKLCNYGSGAAACSPELKTVMMVEPIHYSTSNVFVTNKLSIGSMFQTLNGFASTLGNNGCSGDRYSVSSDGTNFWYYDGTNWVLSNNTYPQTSTASQIDLNISTLVAAMGTGTLQVRTYLNSDGVTPCEVDNILIQGVRY